MAQEKVYIVVSHKNSLRKGSKTEWEVMETVEFRNNLKPRHYSTSSAIGSYLEEKMISGARYGFDTYQKFDSYIRQKYKDQMAQLDKAYKESKETTENVSEVAS